MKKLVLLVKRKGINVHNWKLALPIVLNNSIGKVTFRYNINFDGCDVTKLKGYRHRTGKLQIDIVAMTDKEIARYVRKVENGG